MFVTVTPSTLSGSLAASPSKSHAQRAIALAALGHDATMLSCIGSSDDVQSAIKVAEAMGAQVIPSEDAVNITGGDSLHANTWHCGESGLCLRMFSAIAALYDTEMILSAHGTLSARPVDFMADTFHQLGVTFSSNRGLPPVHIKGPYSRNTALIDGTGGSQFLTGLLMALPLLQQDSTISVHHLKSKPYIDLTLSTIKEFGVSIFHESYETFHIPGGQHYQPATLRIQGDWSGMAFLLVGAALSGEVRITGLPDPVSQADGRILEALELCGATIQVDDDQVITSHNELRAFEFDCTHCPDLFPPLAALAAHCKGISRISGVHRLKSKESDRGFVLLNEFRKLGVRIWQEEDVLFVEGGEVMGGSTESHHDHRIAMALAVTALKANSPVTISGSECVTKSYPNFFEDLASLGGKVGSKN
ncbi:MAG TPA: 3-phosphoshikimate 1-carboxyvinyltransferase [Saprospiraceae bacterium]|nr:3-phosphoshikimate 1-carboxyvinyltransferase [Saprospiraceae bacterium]